MTAMLAILMLTAQPVQDDCTFFRTPESATAEDASKAAQAFATRCRNYGYKGIQTTVVERDGRKLIQVLCDLGLTPEMKSVLNDFARLSGTSVELRFPAAALTDVEKEQFRPGARAADDTAPPGTKWFRFRNPEFSPVLLRDTPVATRGEIQMRTQKERSGSTRIYWDLSLLQTREIREAEKKARLGTPILIMDGWAIEPVNLNTLEKNPEGRIVPALRLYFMPTSHVVQEALAHPMPFTLEGEEAAGEPR
jgi:hypothetical protein